MENEKLQRRIQSIHARHEVENSCQQLKILGWNDPQLLDALDELEKNYSLDGIHCPETLKEIILHLNIIKSYIGESHDIR